MGEANRLLQLSQEHSEGKWYLSRDMGVHSEHASHHWRTGGSRSLSYLGQADRWLCEVKEVEVGHRRDVDRRDVDRRDVGTRQGLEFRVLGNRRFCHLSLM